MTLMFVFLAELRRATVCVCFRFASLFVVVRFCTVLRLRSSFVFALMLVGSQFALVDGVVYLYVGYEYAFMLKYHAKRDSGGLQSVR